MYSYIKVLEENKIAEITLNRPERMNAITVDLLVELKQAVQISIITKILMLLFLQEQVELFLLV